MKPIHELTLPILKKVGGIFFKNLGADVNSIKLDWKDDLLGFHTVEVPIIEAPGEI